MAGLFIGRRSRGTVTVCGIALAVTIGFVLLSPAYGVTFDERARHAHGERVLEFLRGELPASEFTPDDTGRHLYGAIFDAPAAWLHEQLGGNVWEERHYLGAVFAGVGLLATGLLALRLAGAPAGLLALALLALSPRYVGHAANNPKDMPFAALCILALLAFTLLSSRPPFLSWPRAALVGLALALPMNVRPGGLLYLVYFGGLLAMMTIRARAWAPRQLAASMSRLVLVALVTLTAGTIFWPWAQHNPLVRPVIALFQVSRFQWTGDVLFAGEQVKATALPWTYAPVWITMTTPFVVLCGLLWAAGATCLARKDERLWRAGLWAVGLCPLVLAVARHSTLYDGWRHLLFVYPPLVILAASGWRDLIVASSRYRLLGGIAVAALVAGCAEPLVFMLRNHPNEAVYFNDLVGGPYGAFKSYEMDYWGNSLLEATRWTAEVAECAGRPVAVSGVPYDIVARDASRFTSVYPTSPRQAAHHLEIHLLRDTREGLRRTMGRGDILHVVRMDDGAPLAVVLPGPRFGEIETALMAGRREMHPSGAARQCTRIRTEVGRAICDVHPDPRCALTPAIGWRPGNYSRPNTPLK